MLLAFAHPESMDRDAVLPVPHARPYRRIARLQLVHHLLNSHPRHRLINSQVEPERLVVAYDTGRVVNPVLVNGQIHGGAAQGLGGALLEEFMYDDAAQPLSASFMDYLMPTADEMPAVEVLVTEDAPSPLNPLGVKGAGEGGITAVGAAIANAVADALECPEDVTRIPLSPERVRRLVRRRAGGGSFRRQ